MDSCLGRRLLMALLLFYFVCSLKLFKELRLKKELAEIISEVDETTRESQQSAIIIIILYSYIIETIITPSVGRICVFVEVSCYKTYLSDCIKII